MLLKAYLDESGHSSGPVCAVAGFAGDEDRWTAFEGEWLKAIYPRPSLHMKDLRLGSKPERYRELLARAGAVPHRCGLVAIGTTMVGADFVEFVQGTNLEDVLDPYMVCFQYSLAGMLDGLGHDQGRAVGFQAADYLAYHLAKDNADPEARKARQAPEQR